MLGSDFSLRAKACFIKKNGVSAGLYWRVASCVWVFFATVLLVLFPIMMIPALGAELLTPAEGAGSHEPVRLKVGIYQNAPKLFLDDANKPAGFFPDILNHIAEQENWTLDYVPCIWDECLKGVENGTLDLMMDVAFSDARAKRFDFNREVVLSNWSVLYVRKGSEILSILNTDNKSIAVVKGSIQHRAFQERADAFGVHPEFIETQNFQQVFELIDQGKADAGLVNRLYGAQFGRDYDIERSNILVRPSLLHFVVPRDRNRYLIEALDERLMQLKENRGSVYYQAIDRWLTPLEDRGAPVWLLWIAGISGFALIAALFFNVLLRKQVTRKGSELERSLKSLRESETKYRLLVENSPEIVYSYSGKAGGFYYSPRVKDVLGYSPEHLYEHPQLWHDSIHPDDLPMVDKAIAELQNGKNFDLQYRIRDASGEWHWFHDCNIIIQGEESEATIDGLATDITEIKKAEEELIRHRNHLEEIVKERTAEVNEKTRQLAEALKKEKEYVALQQNFVELVSHEFRTPLSIIDGVAQWLIRRKDKMTPGELEKRAGMVRSAITRLISLIDTTLYASRLDAGKIGLKLMPCDIGTLIREICGRQKEISPNHKIKVQLDSVPSQIIADPRRLDHVFTNLLSNAAKYAPRPSPIEVKAWVEGGSVLVSVTDQGVGIPEDDLPYMFERFFRAKTSEGIKGTGIGLNIVKEFVELHKGEISVESIEGEGSTFTVRLPINVQGL